MKKKSKMKSLAAAAILAVNAAIPAVQAAERPLAELPVPIVRVAGEGSVFLAPDLAILNLTVLREAKTAREALSANNDAMAAVIEALKKRGIAPKDLQTSDFSVNPQFFYPQPKSNGEQEGPRITGYQVSNQLSVRIRDLASVGSVIDEVVTLGVNSGGSITFANEDPSKAIEKARIAAMQDAHKRASTLADALGLKLGNVLEISENASMPQPLPMARGKMMANSLDAAVPVEGGQNSYSISVQASWTIEQ
ncbi:MAG: SIMPL domain-containing protein [Rhizobiaceae bacterium]